MYTVQVPFFSQETDSFGGGAKPHIAFSNSIVTLRPQKLNSYLAI